MSIRDILLREVDWVVTNKQWNSLVEQIQNWSVLNQKCPIIDRLNDFALCGHIRTPKRILFEKWKTKPDSTIGRFLDQLDGKQKKIFLERVLDASMDQEVSWNRIKLFVVGDSGVGKTSLISWLKKEAFPEEHTSTVGVTIDTLDAQNWRPTKMTPWDYIAGLVRPNIVKQNTLEATLAAARKVLISCVVLSIFMGLTLMFMKQPALAITICAAEAILMHFADFSRPNQQIEGIDGAKKILVVFLAGLPVSVMLFYGVIIGGMEYAPKIPYGGRVIVALLMIVAGTVLGGTVGAITHNLTGIEVDSTRDLPQFSAEVLKWIFRTYGRVAGVERGERLTAMFVTDAAHRLTRLSFYMGIILHGILLLYAGFEVLMSLWIRDWDFVLMYTAAAIAMGPNCILEARDQTRDENATKDIAIPDDFTSKLLTQPPTTYDVWDFAGQEEYYATHHFFLSASAVYLLVVDISKDIQPDRAKFWLESIKSYAPKAPVILVGTHADLLSQDNNNDVAGDRMKELRTIAKQQHPITDALIVSCKSGDPTETRQHIQEIAYNHFLATKRCKLRWLIYFTSLIESPDPKLNILPATEVTARAQKCRITGEELTQALNFYHELGFIFHFKEDEFSVFTHPHQLIDVLRKVIRHPKRKKRNETDGEKYANALRKDGVFTVASLELFWKKFKPHDIMTLRKLLQAFGLAVPHPKRSEGGIQYLVVPCIAVGDPNSTKAEFENAGRVKCEFGNIHPMGFSNRIIVAMLSIADTNPKRWTPFQGGCVFSYRQREVRVETAQLSVTIQLKEASSNEDSQVMEELVEHTTQVAGKQNGKKVSAWIYCRKCSRSDVAEKIAYSFLCDTCKEDELRGRPALPWFIASRFEDIIIYEPQWQTLVDLFHHQWRDLGHYLGFSKTELDRVERAGPDPTRMLLNKWEHRESATVRTLLDACHKIKNQSAVDEIMKMLEKAQISNAN